MTDVLQPPRAAPSPQSASAPAPAPNPFADAPSSVAFKKLRKRLVRAALEQVQRHRMDQPGAGGAPARWLVCLSGGKDSYGLLSVLRDLQWQGALTAELVACHLDQGQPGYPDGVMRDYLEGLGVPFRILREDTHAIVQDTLKPGATPCSLCSRLRRGILYRAAREEGCTAIVLGHHREDALETFMMNLLHGGRLAAMPPKLLNDAGDVMVLRPLIGCAEADLQRLSDAMRYPIIPCTLCGTQEGLQRAQMKAMLSDWESRRPGTLARMARALATVRPSHLHDARVFDFAALEVLAEGAQGVGEADDGVPF